MAVEVEAEQPTLEEDVCAWRRVDLAWLRHLADCARQIAEDADRAAVVDEWTAALLARIARNGREIARQLRQAAERSR